MDEPMGGHWRVFPSDVIAIGQASREVIAMQERGDGLHTAWRVEPRSSNGTATIELALRMLGIYSANLAQRA